MRRRKALIHLVSSNRWTGKERYALDICRHFIGEGWDVYAVTRDARGVDPLFSEHGVTLLHAPLRGVFDPTSALTIASLLKQCPEGDTIVHVHHYRDAFTALLARKIARRPDVRVVSTRHNARRALNSWLLRRIYRNLDAQIFLSSLSYSRFVSTWHSRPLPYKEERTVILANSLLVEQASITPEPSRGIVTAMFHGALEPGKGLETLIDAMSILKDDKIRFKIVGSGRPDFTDALRRRAQARGVMHKIDWHRHTDRPMELMGLCHFGVLPTVREEAFGLANIEYMACGRPQVTTSSGAQLEYLTDGREAFIVPPLNAAALADAIRHLALDPALRARMGAAAAQRFNSTLAWPLFISRLRKVYLGK